ncbi:zeta toxin family protein [Terasakiella pusilla]|jgi:hypothetical protein|uniref:zeta toxin family protein n=1 Tax=Terasakiella pusilla TaxID=64973 RepID=UPI003AA8AA58
MATSEKGKDALPTKKQPKARIHLTMQGKGGIGKSFVASMLAQYMGEYGKHYVAYDTDPIQQTFKKYKALNVTHLPLSMNGKKDQVNSRAFDKLMEEILTIEKDTDFIVDIGSGTYLPLISYMVENAVTDIITEAGHELLFHAVITGGPAQTDTEEGLQKLFKYFPQTQSIIWMNQFFGPYKVNNDPSDFEKTPLYTDNEEKVFSVIVIPEWRDDTYGDDIQRMMVDALTFDECVECEDYHIMSKHRIGRVKAAMMHSMGLARL